jgi:hypothetical protein
MIFVSKSVLKERKILANFIKNYSNYIRIPSLEAMLVKSDALDLQTAVDMHVHL